MALADFAIIFFLFPFSCCLECHPRLGYGASLAVRHQAGPGIRAFSAPGFSLFGETGAAVSPTAGLHLHSLTVASPEPVTQRIVSWGRSGDGSEFARGNRSVDTEGFCKSQMALNSGLRWLRATLCCFRWNGRKSVPDCPRGHPEATLSHPQAIW